MDLSRVTDRIKFKASTVYNFLNNPVNYESILIDEISEFSMIDEKSFAIKIGSLPKISLEHNSKVLELSTSLKSNNEKLSFVFNFKVSEIDYEDNIGKDMVLKVFIDSKQILPGEIVPKKSKIDFIVGNGIKK
jgi:hypothetical protein